MYSFQQSTSGESLDAVHFTTSFLSNFIFMTHKKSHFPATAGWKNVNEVIQFTVPWIIGCQIQPWYVLYMLVSNGNLNIPVHCHSVWMGVEKVQKSVAKFKSCCADSSDDRRTCRISSPMPFLRSSCEKCQACRTHEKITDMPIRILENESKTSANSFDQNTAICILKQICV